MNDWVLDNGKKEIEESVHALHGIEKIYHLTCIPAEITVISMVFYAELNNTTFVFVKEFCVDKINSGIKSTMLNYVAGYQEDAKDFLEDFIEDIIKPMAVENNTNI